MTSKKPSKNKLFKTKKVMMKTKKSITKASLPPRRRSTRKGAGKRPATYFEQYADDIRAVLLEGEDDQEVLEALQNDSDDPEVRSDDEQEADDSDQDADFVVDDADDTDADEDDFNYEDTILNESDSDDDQDF
jgi:hypothetical protein